MNNDESLFSNLDKLQVTELGIDRIRRNLDLNTQDVVEWCKNKIKCSNSSAIRQGRDYYVTTDDCVIIINSRDYTITTAHKI